MSVSREVALFAEALWMVARVKAQLRRDGDLIRLLDTLSRGPGGSAEARGGWADPAMLAELDRQVSRALRLLGPRVRACVPRSLSLYALLRARGVPAVFVSGVREGPAGLDGHAWVEVSGLPVGVDGQVAGAFRPLWRSPDSTETPVQPPLG